MNLRKSLNKIRIRRKKRTRSRIIGTSEKPRLSIFRSNRYTYGQLIDDTQRKTLVSASTRQLPRSKDSATKIKQAEALGELIAQKAIKEGIKKAIFDRGHYKYHGRIKAIAEGARKKGLQI